MKKNLLLLLTFFTLNSLSAQTFTSTPGAIIPDDNCDVTNEFTLDLTTEGLANLDATFGLETVCINITHSWVTDLTVALRAPDGVLVILTSGNGGSGDNYTNTCFNMSGAAGPITSGSPPFTGTYIPEEDLGLINNGQDPNGVWTLVACDFGYGDEGTLNSWEITFGNTPAPPCSIPATRPSAGADLDLGAACTLGDNTATSEEAGEPEGSCFSGGTQNSVWYKVTGDGTNVTVTTDFTGYTNDDTEVAVYAAANANNYCSFTQVGCDQDGGTAEAYSSVVVFLSGIGTVYYIQLSGYNNTQGTYCIQTFSELAPQGSLPITLTSFSGEPMERTNMLHWVTSSEENTEFLIIERSLDGSSNWEETGRLNAVGNSTQLNKYELEDPRPLDFAYYRLMSLDFDGYKDFSTIISIKRDVKADQVHIYPSPVTKNLTIEIGVSVAADYEVSVVNMMGQIISYDQHNFDEGNQRIEMNTDHLTNGIYHLVVESKTGKQIRKFVKQ